jgi:8-oxo-dGTP pyrophosphatase MutT (NUDIX family)
VPEPLADLLDRYTPRTAAEAADVARVRDLLPGDPWSRDTPLHVTASAVIVHPPTRRALLRWHARQRAWLQVGGHGDPGENDPLAVALREGVEETGLDDLVAWPDGRLVHVAVVPVTPSPTEPAHEHADLRFVLATGTPDAARPEKPGADLRWLTIPDAQKLAGPDNLREALSRVDQLIT